MNAISSLPIGYMTGHFTLAEEMLTAEPSPESLLNLLLLADQLHEEQSGHRPGPEADWESLRQKTGSQLITLLSRAPDPDAVKNWRDRDADWRPKSFRHAKKCIPTMSDGELLTLFIQASETAYLHETQPMQMRWEKVASKARAEILARIEKAGTVPNASSKGNDADDFYYGLAEDDALSSQEMLRVTPRVREVWLLCHAAELTVAEIMELQKLSKAMIARRLRKSETGVARFGPQSLKRTAAAEAMTDQVVSKRPANSGSA